MLCSGRMLACSGLGPGRLRPPRARAERLRPLPPARRWRVAASAAASGGNPDLPSSSSSSSSPTPPFGVGEDQAALSPGFCIIEGPETVQDFAKLDLQEIQDNIRSRRNKIFLHMEEIRRLRIQQRIKNAELGISVEEPDRELPDFPSFIPFLPPLSAANLKVYYATCFTLIAGIMVFGGFLAPILELKLGIGGTSYEDFIRSVHLPMQLSQVDPIVASFSGGAVGVISALMVVEINNVKQQEHKRCKYCLGTVRCLLDPVPRDCAYGVHILRQGMRYGPRPTSVVTTRTVVELIGREGNYPISTQVGLLSLYLVRIFM
ncbi:hypothetical protein GQ55_1G321500 [Panicum hallii var. hallii]|uniref:Uncharacterized protein n=1 Tax=Panicum hallii var. hallii TaxID=1504633 RepID=A0A2T7F9S1_9POAL|nr:hypothetical protein GQ55_1G321500 [Panicum hallii var. hallii]